MALTAAQVAEFCREGLIMVPGINSADEMDRALEQVDRITYGKPFVEWVAADGISHAVAFGRPQFPT